MSFREFNLLRMEALRVACWENGHWMMEVPKCRIKKLTKSGAQSKKPYQDYNFFSGSILYFMGVFPWTNTQLHEFLGHWCCWIRGTSKWLKDSKLHWNYLEKTKASVFLKNHSIWRLFVDRNLSNLEANQKSMFFFLLRGGWDLNIDWIPWISTKKGSNLILFGLTWLKLETLLGFFGGDEFAHRFQVGLATTAKSTFQKGWFR